MQSKLQASFHVLVTAERDVLDTGLVKIAMVCGPAVAADAVGDRSSRRRCKEGMAGCCGARSCCGHSHA